MRRCDRIHEGSRLRRRVCAHRDGPHVRIIEHPAHAQGHAALLIERRSVLVAGDMLSDIPMPFPDLDAADPIEDDLVGLRLLEAVADGVDVLIPGHGSVGGADELRARIELDRAYVQALRDGHAADDPEPNDRRFQDSGLAGLLAGAAIVALFFAAVYLGSVAPPTSA